MIQLRLPERPLILRVRCLAFPFEWSKFFLASAANCFNEVRIRVADEVLERRRLSVFIAHEEQRHEWREQHDTRSQFVRLEGDKPARPLSHHTIAYLIVVLREYDK